MKDLNLLEKMHSSIEFEVADHKRRKEVIKVRTIKHLHEKLERTIMYICQNLRCKIICNFNIRE